MYIHRREDHLVDALIEDHFWLKLTVNDGTTGTGTYTVSIFDGLFGSEDTTAGADDSATIVADFKAQINASSQAVTAFDGPTASELYIRFDKFGQTPVDTYNQIYNYAASTTDDGGTITLVPVRPESYAVKNAANWDGAFAAMETVSFVSGARSDKYQSSNAMMANQVYANQLQNRTRFLFDPADYSLDDKDVLFFQTSPVFGGVEVHTKPIEIVMSTQQYRDQRTPLLLTGTAPAGASQDDALTFELPRKAIDFSIRNVSAGDNVFVSFGTGSSEISVGSNEKFSDNRPGFERFSVRGDGIDVDVEIYLVLSHSPSL